MDAISRVFSLFEWMPTGMQVTVGAVVSLLLVLLVLKIIKVALDALPFV